MTFNIPKFAQTIAKLERADRPTSIEQIFVAIADQPDQRQGDAVAASPIWTGSESSGKMEASQCVIC